MTKSQKKVYDAYKEFIDLQGRIPTYRELGKILGVSPSCAHNHISNLYKQGELYISMETNKDIQVPIFIADIIDNGIKNIIEEIRKLSYKK